VDPALSYSALRFLDEPVQGQILRNSQQDFMPFEEEESEGDKLKLDLDNSSVLFGLSYRKGRMKAPKVDIHSSVKHMNLKLTRESITL